MIGRGQILTSRAKIKQETGLSDRQIRTCLERLQTTNEVTIQSTNVNSVITICNYDSYQNAPAYNDQPNDQQSAIRTTSERPTITQEDNKVKNQEEVSETSVSSCQLALRDRPQPHRINGTPRAKPVPYDEIFAMYADKCPSLVKVRVRDQTRKRGAKRLWGRAGGSKDPKLAMEYIGLFFDGAQDSPFLRGEKQTEKYPGNYGLFEVITRDEWITKIMEGRAL